MITLDKLISTLLLLSAITLIIEWMLAQKTKEKIKDTILATWLRVEHFSVVEFISLPLSIGNAFIAELLRILAHSLKLIYIRLSFLTFPAIALFSWILYQAGGNLDQTAIVADHIGYETGAKIARTAIELGLNKSIVLSIIYLTLGPRIQLTSATGGSIPKNT